MIACIGRAGRSQLGLHALLRALGHWDPVRRADRSGVRQKGGLALAAEVSATIPRIVAAAVITHSSAVGERLGLGTLLARA